MCMFLQIVLTDVIYPLENPRLHLAFVTKSNGISKKMEQQKQVTRTTTKKESKPFLLNLLFIRLHAELSQYQKDI